MPFCPCHPEFGAHVTVVDSFSICYGPKAKSGERRVCRVRYIIEPWPRQPGSLTRVSAQKKGCMHLGAWVHLSPRVAWLVCSIHLPSPPDPTPLFAPLCICAYVSLTSTLAPPCIHASGPRVRYLGLASRAPRAPHCPPPPITITLQYPQPPPASSPWSPPRRASSSCRPQSTS